METIRTCKVTYPIKTRLLVWRLAQEKDTYRALELIKAYFETELGAVTHNDIISEITEGQSPLYEYHNSTDPNDLYPTLQRACIEMAKETLPKHRQQTAIDHISRFMEKWRGGEIEPQTGLFLPVGLQKYSEQVNTHKAVVCFAVAISKGLIERTETGYRKCKGVSKAQLAYFLQCVYVDARKGGTLPDTALCKMFEETGIKQAASQIANSKTGKPRGYSVIDDVLKVADAKLSEQPI